MKIKVTMSDKDFSSFLQEVLNEKEYIREQREPAIRESITVSLFSSSDSTESAVETLKAMLQNKQNEPADNETDTFSYDDVTKMPKFQK